MLKQKQKKSGFTLIELMIVIAMIAILSAVAVPRFQAWLPVYRLKSAASDLHSNMQKARIQAIKENQTVQMRFDNTHSPGFYYFDSDSDGVHDSDEFRVDLSSYASGVDFGTGNATLNWSRAACKQATIIGFGTRGTANMATVFLENEKGTVCYAITTSIAGTAKVRMYNGVLPFNTAHWIQ